MPHVIVKPWPGKTEQQKKRLTEEITRSVMKVLNTERLYKKPGYTM